MKPTKECTSFRNVDDDELLETYENLREELTDLRQPPWILRSQKGEAFDRLRDLRGEMEIRMIEPEGGWLC